MSKYKNYKEEQLKTDGIKILVYEITDKSSFDVIEKWFEMINKIALGKNRGCSLS